VGEGDGDRHRRGGGSVTGREGVKVGQIDQRERAPAGVAGTRSRHGALQELDEDVRPGVGEKGGQAEPRLSQRDQGEPDRERRPGAAQMRDPAHHAGTGIGPDTGANASASGRPS